MHDLTTKRRLASVLAGALLLSFAATAQAQSSASDMAVQFYSEPDEFYFFGDERKLVVDYKKDRMVRVCVGDSTHTVPLKISYDNKQATIEAGDCMRVEAKKVFLEPQKTLDTGWVLEADVDTLS